MANTVELIAGIGFIRPEKQTAQLDKQQAFVLLVYKGLEI